jgi:inosine-uridine nucleoside N-ribohydrolase
LTNAYFYKEWLQFFAKTYADVFGMIEGPPLHDPLAIALALHPEWFTLSYLNVEVECSSPLSAGQTVCDVYRTTGRSPNVHVATSVQTDKFWAFLIQAIHSANAESPLNK